MHPFMTQIYYYTTYHLVIAFAGRGLSRSDLYQYSLSDLACRTIYTACSSPDNCMLYSCALCAGDNYSAAVAGEYLRCISPRSWRFRCLIIFSRSTVMPMCSS